ncbi:DUF4097 family beta strand repeat-containing protein [Actinomadura kijaniata]|uniref:DUF4097 family beta strand repeat-containing protein n=1 Tax=Actinomadura kijaniata TaxID=46161 RepID=UPI0008298B46|nr:DUF4097 family beta strand repeat-containing protein [Actinomadura kijaniata]
MRRFGVVVLFALGASALGACGLVPDRSFEDDPALTGRITSVRLENRSGDVTVRGADDGTVSLHRRVAYTTSPPEGPTHRVENGVLVLGDCGVNCEVDYTVVLPKGTPVSGSTSNGEIALTAVGAVDVATGSGDVTVTTAVPQNVRVKTSNGEIALTVPRGSYQVRAQSKNGDRNLRVPHTPGAGRRIDLTTGNGDITVSPA